MDEHSDEYYMYFDMDLDLSPYYDGQKKESRKFGNVLKKTNNNRLYKRAQKRVVSGETGKCDRCPWHAGENAGLSRQPRDDKYKGRRRERQFKKFIVDVLEEHYYKSVLPSIQRDIEINNGA
jgi:hypothetical protein